MSKETIIQKIRYWSLGVGVAALVGYAVYFTQQENIEKYQTFFPSSEKTAQILKESGLENVCNEGIESFTFIWNKDVYKLTCDDKVPKLFNESAHKWYLRDRNGPK